MWGSGLTYTRLANLAAMVYLCLKSLAHLDARYLAASLLFNAMSPMFVRAGPLNSMLVDEAKQCGMSVGQLCGARDSLRAVSMMVAPLLYSRVYGWARRFRGAPYLCGAALMAVSQCCLLGVTCEAAHESPEARFDMLIEAIGDISEGEDKAASVLARLKASWGHDWGLTDAGRHVLVDFVHRVCSERAAPIKSYDELNAIALYHSMLYATGRLRELNIDLIKESSPTGHSFTGVEVRMGQQGGNHKFHEFNNALIEDLASLKRTPRKPIGATHHMTVITDPRTDPNEDDAAALCAVLGLDLKYKLLGQLDLLVTGCPGSLDARRRGIRFVEKCHGSVHTECAPIKGPAFETGKGRFMAPYGAGSSQQDMEECAEEPGSETQAIAAGCHIVERIAESTTALLLIGQVPSDFFEAMTLRLENGGLPKLARFSLQGPGFNSLGSSPEAIAKFVTALQHRGGHVQWSDNTAGLFLTGAEIDQRFELLGRLNPEIPVKRRNQVASFWATSGLPRHFEGQFGDMRGYSYTEDTVPLLKLLRPRVVAGQPP